MNNNENTDSSYKGLIFLIYIILIFVAIIWGASIKENCFDPKNLTGTLFYGSLISAVVFASINIENRFFIGVFNFRNYLAGIWTSLGILGTFITLVKQLNTNDLANILQDANETAKFLKNFGSAFTTSIVGIVGSIFTKMILTYFDESDEVEKRSERSYLSDLLKAQNEMVELLKTQNTQSAEKQSSLKTNFQNISEKLENILSAYEVQNKAQNDKIEVQNQKIVAVGELLLQMKTLFETQMNALVTSVTQNLEPKITELSKKMFENLETITKQLAKESKENLAANYDRVWAESQTVISAQKTALETIFTEFKTAQATQASDMERAQQTQSENLQQMVTDMKTQLDVTTKAMQLQFETISEQMQANLTATQAQQNTLQTTAADNLQNLQNEAFTQTQNLQNAVNEQIENLQNDFQNAVGDYAQEIKTILETVQNWQTANREMVENANTSFAKSVALHDKNVLNQQHLEQKLANSLEKLDTQEAKLNAFEQSAQQLHQDLKNQNGELLNKITDLVDNLEIIKNNWK